VCPKNPHNFNVDNVRVVKISGEDNSTAGWALSLPISRRMLAPACGLAGCASPAVQGAEHDSSVDMHKCGDPAVCLSAPPFPGAGGGLHDSHVVRGMVLKRGVEGSIQRVADAKVAVFAQGVDTASTETKVGGGQPAGTAPHRSRPLQPGCRLTCLPSLCGIRLCVLQLLVYMKAHTALVTRLELSRVAWCLQGTVLIRSAEELEGYSRSEENRIEEIINSIAGALLLGHALLSTDATANSSLVAHPRLLRDMHLPCRTPPRQRPGRASYPFHMPFLPSRLQTPAPRWLLATSRLVRWPCTSSRSTA
jgi:hypothetical protein